MILKVENALKSLSRTDPDCAADRDLRELNLKLVSKLKYNCRDLYLISTISRLLILKLIIA